MAADAPHQGRGGRKAPIGDLGGPLVAGLALALVGGVVVDRADWGIEAYWVVATVAGGLAFALYARRDVARRRDVGESQDSIAADTTAEPPAADETRTVEAVDMGIDVGGFVEGPVEQSRPSRVVVLSGRSRSGKTKIADAMVRAHPDWTLVSCGAFVRSEAARRGLDVSREVTDRIGQQLVDELGGDGFLTAVLEHASVRNPNGTLIIDDVYHVPVMRAIKDRWAYLTFVEVKLPPSVEAALVQRPIDTGPPRFLGAPELDRHADAVEREFAPALTVEGVGDDLAAAEQRASELSQRILATAA